MHSIDEIKKFVSNHFSEASGSHSLEHTYRVYNLCMHIGKVEGADLEVLAIAAYLHDIARPYEDESKGTICHGEKGAEIASALLESFPISEEKKANILHCIRAHRFRGKTPPQTLEAKVLFDADKLDAIGAIGIARAFLFAGEVGAKLHNPGMEPENTSPYSQDDTGYREFKLKLCRIKDTMLTQEGNRLARERHEFMELFFQRFLEEHEGLK
ncbi:MAG: HD domain-containing protein [Deltaproteobacteria bacterium]|nr:HD domain-containing protein [Deltaproteobacteria bacterium]MBW1919263.1 HD domain-containing protein [Deltaproteobacteria bacterium]MBW1935084.1 HD domain-containing protein [Deltaproteobacteria bacterium]MBW1977656.1 HD domain-containing protein [Deltaproteobacteria bacterium]MBW2044970.1 HD domain-containing protein [Deltaproteobacteria bacterium]